MAHRTFRSKEIVKQKHILRNNSNFLSYSRRQQKEWERWFSFLSLGTLNSFHMDSHCAAKISIFTFPSKISLYPIYLPQALFSTIYLLFLLFPSCFHSHSSKILTLYNKTSPKVIFPILFPIPLILYTKSLQPVIMNRIQKTWMKTALRRRITSYKRVKLWTFTWDNFFPNHMQVDFKVLQTTGQCPFTIVPAPSIFSFHFYLGTIRT